MTRMFCARIEHKVREIRKCPSSSSCLPDPPCSRLIVKLKALETSVPYISHLVPCFVLKFKKPSPLMLRFKLKFKAPDPIRPRFVVKYKTPESVVPCVKHEVKEPSPSSMPPVTIKFKPDYSKPIYCPYLTESPESYDDDGTGNTFWLCHSPLDADVTSATDRDEWSLEPQTLKAALEEVIRNNDLDKLYDYFSRTVKECDHRIPRWDGLGRALKTYFSVVSGVELSLEECEKEKRKLWGIAVADRLWRHTGNDVFRTVYSVKDRE